MQLSQGFTLGLSCPFSLDGNHHTHTHTHTHTRIYIYIVRKAMLAVV